MCEREREIERERVIFTKVYLRNIEVISEEQTFTKKKGGQVVIVIENDGDVYFSCLITMSS